MSLAQTAVHALEGAPIPDAMTRAGVRWLVGQTRRRLASAPVTAERAFVRDMALHPIAENTAEANAQHYELPPEFFALALGPRRKYSCCRYGLGDDLATAEEAALAETCRHADLQDGQSILELGCGWGSLSLWMAEHYPGSRITAVSNSHSQRRHIEAEARRLGFGNLEVITADMNSFCIDKTFDRVVSVEMFEHMSNWQGLLSRVRGWLKPDGRLFAHMVAHRLHPHRIDDDSGWIGKYVLAGGVMPSHGLIGRFPDLFQVEADWRWSGLHYEQTALDWLANYDRNATEVMAVLRTVYGDQARLWFRRWRLFFLATAGLFGHDGGAAWGVSHYRLKPAR